MTCTVILSALIEAVRRFPRFKRAPAGSRFAMPNHKRRLNVVTLAAADGILLVETGSNRTNLPARGDLAAMTVDVRVLLHHLDSHAGLAVLSIDGGLAIKSSRGFRSVVPVK